MSHYQVMPDLDPDVRDALAADIKANGILQPILEDEAGNVIDGHNRKAIADELGIRCPAIKCPPNLTDAQKRTLAYGVNAHRRHLTREQTRQLIAASLRDDPELSNRQHAERIGVSHVTVGAVRDELESTGQVDQLTARVGADGRERPAKVTTTTRTTEATKIERDIDLATGEVLPPGGPKPTVKPKPAPAPDPIDAAIDEFPFLADYPPGDVLSTADALRAIPEGPERDRRIEAAKTWPAAVAAADDIAAAGDDPVDYLDAAISRLADAAGDLVGLPLADLIAATDLDLIDDQWRPDIDRVVQIVTDLHTHLNRPRTLRSVQ